MSVKAGLSATPANVVAAAASTELFAANPAAVERSIWNDSTAYLYVKYGTAASPTSCKVKVDPDGYFEFPAPLYRGVVHGYWSAANGAARTTEVV